MIDNWRINSNRRRESKMMADIEIENIVIEEDVGEVSLLLIPVRN